MLIKFKNKHLYLLLSILILLIATTFSSSFQSHAKTFEEKQIKAAYIINFIKHIHWPNEGKKEKYLLAIYKDNDFYQFLSSALNNKQVAGKSVEVILVTTISPLVSADVVYIDEKHNTLIPKISRQLSNSQTLLITNNSLTKHNVMINIVHNKSSNNITFEVNKSNIIYEKLTMSAQLLLLGGSELDVAILYREMEKSMQQTRQQAIELTRLLSSQQTQLKQTGLSLENANLLLSQSKQKLKKLNTNFNRTVKETKQQKLELTLLKKEINSKTVLFNQQESKLVGIASRLTAKEQQLINQENQLAAKEQQNQQMLIQVDGNKDILLNQKQQLQQQKALLTEQGDKLGVQDQTIISQQFYLFVTTVLVTISVVVTLLLILLILRNKRTNKKLTTTLDNLKSTQKQLIQAEKMASLGSLIAGVAHEINTPLSIAITSNSLVLDDTEEVKQSIINNTLSKTRMMKHIDKVDQSLTIAEGALERVKVLLANFKQVAVDQEINDQRELNLAEYIADIMSTLSIEMKRHQVNYKFLTQDQVNIVSFPGELAQVLTNLVNNSIIHGFDQQTNGNISISLVKANNGGAKIIYQDDGVGMTEDVLNNIFEPFFTTKRGQGSTGLGMNIVYNIIQAKLQGDIEINSELGKGSTFTITLPKTIKL